MGTGRSLGELARAIDAHLKRIEQEANDPTRFFHACAGATNRAVQVRYVYYDGGCPLTREQAAAYLAWLDAGNVGRHYRALPHRTAR
jgi:hypothetical protein